MILMAWERADIIGLPLNIMITVRPENIDNLEPWQRCQEVQRVMNIYGEFARRHHFRQAALYTRECAPDNTGEHFHILCHAPVSLREKLKCNALAWLPGDGEVHVTNASYQTRWRNGLVGNAALYIAKQMSPQARYGRPYQWQRGGTIIGARWGCTRNLICELNTSGRGWTYARWRASAGRMVA